MYYTAASPPPRDVVATQSSSSALVEVSWSPPSDAASGVIGYRIYYGNGQNVFVLSVAVITSVSLKVDGNYIGQNVSIRSEADQLYSELVDVSVTESKYSYLLILHAMYYNFQQWSPKVHVSSSEQCAAATDISCTTEIGIAIGTVTVVESLIVTVITILVVLCVWR